MNEPVNNPFGGAVWRRGAVLGLQWAAVFFAATLAAFGLLGVVGWSGTVRALCAMGIGPVLALVIIAVWWAVRRPTLTPPAPGGEDSRTDTHAT